MSRPLGRYTFTVDSQPSTTYVTVTDLLADNWTDTTLIRVDKDVWPHPPHRWFCPVGTLRRATDAQLAAWFGRGFIKVPA